MPFKKHPRHVTEQQFAEGTTVDGSRLDDAMEDFIQHHNNIPSSDISTRHTASTYFSGWIPQKPGLTPDGPHFPWQTAFNTAAGSTGASIPNVMSNPERVKGYQIPGVPPRVDSVNNQQFVWATCFPFDKPVIVKRVFVQMAIDTAGASVVQYSMNPVYGATAPPGFAAAQETQDFTLSLEVSSPLSPENRQHTDVEIARNQFIFNRDLFRPVAWPGAATDMNPSGWPGGAPAGWIIPLEVDVPLHQESIARLNLVIPPSISGASPYNSPWLTEPWFQCHWGVTLVVLEGLE
tara:strand:- start:1267 stop:2142 length:876 start_codon:yes stop_codon:yes gene_type:complete